MAAILYAIAAQSFAVAAGRKQPRPQQDDAPRYILPAMREPGDDENAPVTQQEFVTPYGLPAS